MNEEEYKTRIAELEQKLEEAQKANEENDFNEIKEQYEQKIKEKNKEIEDLKKEVDNTKNKVDDTVDKLNEEIQARLDANEEYQNALSTIKELEQSKAEATVDTYIQKGVILPKQRETALKLCINDPETFSDLYRDAKPIVNTEGERKSIPTSTAERIANYFKN